VEKKVYWSLDVIFREDDSRIRRLACNLLRPRPSLYDKPGKPPKTTSLQRKRLMCCWPRLPVRRPP